MSISLLHIESFDACLDIVFIWDIDMLIILIWASNVDFYVLHCYISLVH